MQTRLKTLREVLKLSQAKFAEKIGLTQGTWGAVEIGKNNLTERNFNSICDTFNVNPEWLRNGVGEMFKSNASQNFLDKLADDKGLNSAEKTLLKSLIELPANVREGIIDWALNLAKEINAQNPELTLQGTPTQNTLQELIAKRNEIDLQIAKLRKSEGEIDDNLPRDKKIALVNQELDAAEKRQILSVSITTSGLAKQNNS